MPLPRAAPMTLTSALTSLIQAFENRKYGPKAADLEVKRPLFILGHWRSGTTRTSSRHAAPLARPASDGSSPVGWLLRQVLTFRAVPEEEVDRWKASLTLLYKKLTWKSGRPLVLKSPPHTGRIALLLQMFPAPRELATLHSLRSDLRQRAFFACWTRKEALAKAEGKGLALPLRRFDVTLIPGEPAMLLDTEGDPLAPTRWTLREIDPGPGYVAALAVEGDGLQLLCWQYTDV